MWNGKDDQLDEFEDLSDISFSASVPAVRNEAKDIIESVFAEAKRQAEALAAVAGTI